MATGNTVGDNAYLAFRVEDTYTLEDRQAGRQRERESERETQRQTETNGDRRRQTETGVDRQLDMLILLVACLPADLHVMCVRVCGCDIVGAYLRRPTHDIFSHIMCPSKHYIHVCQSEGKRDRDRERNGKRGGETERERETTKTMRKERERETKTKK